MENNMNISKMRAMFQVINADCQVFGETIVPLTDVAYYTCQIRNIYSIPRSEANGYAKEMAALEEELNYEPDSCCNYGCDFCEPPIENDWRHQ